MLFFMVMAALLRNGEAIEVRTVETFCGLVPA